MPSNWFPKSPGATRRVSYDWRPFLTSETGDTITGASWEYPNELQVTDPDYGGPSLIGGVATLWVTGGDLGLVYTIESKIQTNLGTKESGFLHLEIIET